MTSSARPSPPAGGQAVPAREHGADEPRAAPPHADPWEALRRPPTPHAAGWEALVRAAREVPSTNPQVRQGLLSAAALEGPVAWLCQAVGDALAGRAPTLAESQAMIPLRPLLDGLRAGFLEAADGLAAAGGAADVLPVLRAIEQVQAALAVDSAQRLADRLAEGDAMNLVVEVAHDMRSPLSSILFLVERIRRGQSGPVTPVQERQLGLMYSAAFGLGTLASDVMELARGGDRLVSHRPLAFSVQEILNAVRDVVQPMAEEKRLELVFGSLDPDWRVGYPQALNRVLLNLVTNALKFTNEGRVTLTPRAIGRERVEFVVEDTGRGIPPHVMATLFDAFRRRQAMGDYAFSSAGLGLSICRKLIVAMGGELTVETELERGTRFRFTLEMPPSSRY